MFSPHHAGSRDEGVVLANARAIHSAVFHPGDATVAYSAGDDHAVRTIDLTTGRVVSSIETRSALLCLAALPSPTASSSSSSSSSPLLAAGRDDDCAIVLLDPRVTATHPAVLTLRGHMRWVTSLAAAPAAGHHQQQLVSAGYDGTVRLWDLRNSRTETEVVDAGSRRVGDPLWVIRREGWETPKERKRRVAAGEDEPRLFSVAWDRSWGIVSGGSDRKIQINRVPES